MLDVNEPPIFLSSHYVTSVSEGMTIGNVLFNGIVAIDNDEVKNNNNNNNNNVTTTILL